MKLDPEDLRAIAHLRHDPNFTRVVAALGNYANELTETFIKKDYDSGKLYQQKGMCKAATAILEAIVEAPRKLENIEAHREQ